jgi:hypothetical protein
MGKSLTVKFLLQCGVYIPGLSDIPEVVVPIMISVIADRVSAIKEAADPRVPAG